VIEALVHATLRGSTSAEAETGSPHASERKRDLHPLGRACASVWIDNGLCIAHAKSVVIDDTVRLEGLDGVEQTTAGKPGSSCRHLLWST
jgi:hypothetical protein